jgi:hypothetical protein
LFALSATISYLVTDAVDPPESMDPTRGQVVDEIEDYDPFTIGPPRYEYGLDVR